jgi:hypothetical protein
LKNINPSKELFVDFLLKNYEQFLLPPEDIFRAGNNLKTAISSSRLKIKKINPSNLPRIKKMTAK